MEQRHRPLLAQAGISQFQAERGQSVEAIRDSFRPRRAAMLRTCLAELQAAAPEASSSF